MSINTVNNNIWFVGNITDVNVHYIIQELEKLQTSNVSLFLNTGGGSVDEGLFLFDYLQYRAKINSINIVGVSTVDSSGSYSLFTDNPTFFYPHCSVLLHPIGTTIENKLETNNFLAVANRIERLTKQVADIYAGRGLTDATWQSKSCYYTANDMVSLGVGQLWSNPTITIGTKNEKLVGDIK